MDEDKTAVLMAAIDQVAGDILGLLIPNEHGRIPFENVVKAKTLIDSLPSLLAFSVSIKALSKGANNMARSEIVSILKDRSL